jgi:DNA-binding LacI/PurR family transcriptional regulator
MVSLKDISVKFGVSMMTVSNALNGRKGVAAELATVICQYAKEQGYRPAYMAQSLLRGRTNMVGLCMRESLEEPWTGWMLQRIQDGLMKRGYHLHLSLVHGGAEQVAWSLNFFRELRVDGVIIGPLGFREEYDAIAGLLKHQPYVVAFDALEELPIDHLRNDASQGAAMAVNHLLANGHRKIGFIGHNRYERQHPTARTLFKGYVDALAALGLEYRPEWVADIDVRALDLSNANLTAIFARKKPWPTAFLCHNDLYAIRAVKSLAERGVRVPDDVSIIGFDNYPLSESIIPGITSIGFDLGRYATKIVDTVITGMKKSQQKDKEEKNEKVRQYVEKPVLFARESVRNLNVG